MHRLKCHGCGRMFEGKKDTRRRFRFHSPKCYQQWIAGRPEARARALAGGKKRQALARAKLTARLLAQLGEGATLAQAYWLGMRDAAISAYRRGERKGYADGYERALKDSRQAA